MPFFWLGPVMGRESGVHPKHSKGLDCSPKLDKRQALIPFTGKFFFRFRQSPHSSGASPEELQVSLAPCFAGPVPRS